MRRPYGNSPVLMQLQRQGFSLTESRPAAPGPILISRIQSLGAYGTMYACMQGVYVCVCVLCRHWIGGGVYT